MNGMKLIGWLIVVMAAAVIPFVIMAWYEARMPSPQGRAPRVKRAVSPRTRQAQCSQRNLRPAPQH